MAGAAALVAVVAYLIIAGLSALAVNPLVAVVVAAVGAWLGLLLARPFVMAILARFAARRAVGGGALWWLFILVRRLLR